MRNVTHPEAARYEKTRPSANVAAAVFPHSECNHLLGAPRLTSVRQRSLKDENHCRSGQPRQRHR
jgi:hypothetical protein